MRLILLVTLWGGFSEASHWYRYFYTSVSGISDFPEFVSVGYLDDKELNYYESGMKEMVPRHSAMELTADAEFYQRNTHGLRRWQQIHKANMQALMDRTNQSGGIHIYQQMYGCELQEDGSTGLGFIQHGWDGSDFMSFDKEHKVWVTPLMWAVMSKQKWDQNKAFNQQEKSYLEGTCIEWLKKYLEYGKRDLRPVPPQMFLSVAKASDIEPVQLSCLITGFYPRDIEVTLLRNGAVIMETHSTGVLPNHNGTYQLRRWAQINPKDGATYSCQYEHRETGMETRDWDGTFRLTARSLKGIKLSLIGGIIFIVLIAVFTGVVVMKKRGQKNSAHSPANSAEKGHSLSDSSVHACNTKLLTAG